MCTFLRDKVGKGPLPSLEWQKSAWLELHEHENANCTSTKVVDLDALPSEGGFMHGKKWPILSSFVHQSHNFNQAGIHPLSRKKNGELSVDYVFAKRKRGDES